MNDPYRWMQINQDMVHELNARKNDKFEEITMDRLKKFNKYQDEQEMHAYTNALKNSRMVANLEIELDEPQTNSDDLLPEPLELDLIQSPLTDLEPPEEEKKQDSVYFSANED